jgi:glycosyltransferase involved in cell wall biosynthesis
MRISFSTIPMNLELSNGYGIAGYNVVTSLQRLGHTVPWQDKNTRVQIHFSQPQWKKFFRGQYKIIYTPWESTELQEGWKTKFNRCDEVWTTSPLIKNWYKEAGVKKPIYVYEHGVDPRWSRVEYKEDTFDRPLRFLHVGAPSPRKDARMAVRAFTKAFPERIYPDVSLTLKSYAGDHLGDLGDPRIIRNTSMPTDIQMNQIYMNHDIIVYPSWGEGFGLIPLQAMYYAKPVISTAAWAPYHRFLEQGLKVRSRLVESPWPEIHPGMMFQPEEDDLIRAYREAYENRELYTKQAQVRAVPVAQEYNWDRLTEGVMAHVVDMFGDNDIIVDQ